jgi:cysteine synthase
MRLNRLTFQKKEIIPTEQKCYNPCKSVKVRIATLIIKEPDKHMALRNITEDDSLIRSFLMRGVYI